MESGRRVKRKRKIPVVLAEYSLNSPLSPLDEHQSKSKLKVDDVDSEDSESKHGKPSFLSNVGVTNNTENRMFSNIDKVSDS